MGERTGIEWTDHTFNPWWGCVKVSPACTNCYAETFAGRFPKTAGLWGPNAPRRVASEKTWHDPVRWNRAAAAEGVRRRVFCASMADVFEDRPDLDAHRARLFNLIWDTQALDWLLLTKRPENVLSLMLRAYEAGRTRFFRHGALEEWAKGGRPFPNVWIGTTVEDQERADQRLPELLKIPAAVRFLSCEPLLGPLDLELDEIAIALETGPNENVLGPLGWVIAGGESGDQARPMHPDWAASLRDQCAGAGVPFFFKQWGEWVPGYRQGVRNELLRLDGTPEPHPPVAGMGRRVFQGETACLALVGKKAAGALLDGVSHKAFPEVTRG